jgi:ABC-type multidrug transport system fused ATPase/permease subunit
MCLARALCHKAKIIVLDEATSSVDFETDEKVRLFPTFLLIFFSLLIFIVFPNVQIQETIANEFYGYTVITVAHRMNTIRDYDMILVMQDGVVAELGRPQELLRDPDSKFYKMINSGGSSASVSPASPIVH